MHELLPDEIAAQFIGGTHTRRFADNLVGTLTTSQIRILRQQLAAGAGNELSATATGKRRAHNPASSAALAFSAFGFWLGYESELELAGLAGYTERLVVECKQKIAHGGGTANFDVFLKHHGAAVAVESKLTETLDFHEPVEWKSAYHASEMTTLLDGGWREVFEASLAGNWTPKQLGLEQLIKHALALASMDVTERHLVYCYWEPCNGDDIEEVGRHRKELAELVARVGAASPQIHHLTYCELWADWSQRELPAGLAAHVAALRERYELTVPPA